MDTNLLLWLFSSIVYYSYILCLPLLRLGLDFEKCHIQRQNREKEGEEKNTHTHTSHHFTLCPMVRKTNNYLETDLNRVEMQKKKTIRHEKRGRQSEKCVTNGRTKKEFIPKAYYIITNIEMYVTYIQYNSLFHILYAPSSSIFIRLYSLVLSISFTPSLHSRNICPWCFGCFVFHVDGRQLNWKLEQPTMTVEKQNSNEWTKYNNNKILKKK